MDLTLECLCKELRLSGVYTYVLEYSPDNDDLKEFLTSALQAELDKRQLNRQMKSLRLAGFPTKKRFEDLIQDDLPQDGREAIPVLKALDFLKEPRNVIFIGNSGTGGESIMGWNLDLPKVVASLHANLSEVIPKMEFIIIASKRQLPKRQPIIASRPRNGQNSYGNCNRNPGLRAKLSSCISYSCGFNQ